MDMHKNARLAPLGRERLVKMVLGGQRSTPPASQSIRGQLPSWEQKIAFPGARWFCGWRARRKAA